MAIVLSQLILTNRQNEIYLATADWRSFHLLKATYFYVSKILGIRIYVSEMAKFVGNLKLILKFAD